MALLQKIKGFLIYVIKTFILLILHIVSGVGTFVLAFYIIGDVHIGRQSDILIVFMAFAALSVPFFIVRYFILRKVHKLFGFD